MAALVWPKMKQQPQVVADAANFAATIFAQVGQQSSRVWAIEAD